MTVLDQILQANRQFVARLPTHFSRTTPKPSKLPRRELAVFTCMDTRLVDFLEPAVGIRREDAVVIKNAGNSVTGPFEASIRSLLLAIFELGVKEILVIGHEDCGAACTDPAGLTAKMLARGISPDAIKMIDRKLCAWLDDIKHPKPTSPMSSPASAPTPSYRRKYPSTASSSTPTAAKYASSSTAISPSPETRSGVARFFPF